MNRLKCLCALLGLTLSLAGHADPFVYCTSTNEGMGGDEGYEVEIVNSKKGLMAHLTVIDPGGGRVYSRVPVEKKGAAFGYAYVGKEFHLEIYSDLPTTADGYVFSQLKMKNEFGASLASPTLCSGEGI